MHPSKQASRRPSGLLHSSNQCRKSLQVQYEGRSDVLLIETGIQVQSSSNGRGLPGLALYPVSLLTIKQGPEHPSLIGSLSICCSG